MRVLNACNYKMRVLMPVSTTKPFPTPLVMLQPENAMVSGVSLGPRSNGRTVERSNNRCKSHVFIPDKQLLRCSFFLLLHFCSLGHIIRFSCGRELHLLKIAKLSFKHSLCFTSSSPPTCFFAACFMFYHLHSLAAQDCACKGHLTDLEILGLEETQVGRYHVSGAQDHLGCQST